MTAYVIMIRNATNHPEHLERYMELAPLAPSEGVRFLAKNSDFDVVEGAPAEKVVILSFPTMARARDWYDSPEYQAAVPHRLAAADYRTIIVDGEVNVPPGYPGS